MRLLTKVHRLGGTAMAEIARDQAVQRLTQALPPMGPDDLAEVYNELFPTQPATVNQARQERARLLDRITDHIRLGLQPEEIVALWNVVFPNYWKVVYDEETNTIQYRDETEPVEYAD
jgi:hypothetical protein